MRKYCFILASVLVSMFWATDANAQITVGAGYNLETITMSAQGDSDSESLNGFYLEATYDWKFLDKSWGALALQPGVRFAYMGESETEKEDGLRMKSSWDETYLDIPVHVKYTYGLGSVKLSAFAGPVFSFGLSSTNTSRIRGEVLGKDVDYLYKYNNYTGKTITKGEGTTSSTEGGLMDYGRFDLKLGIGLGASFMERYNVKVGYNIGLLNRYTGEQMDDYRFRMSTGVFYLGVGYSF